jgi:ABC-type polysaccharide/polyol phosphate transport system ATPase subunit
MSTTIQVDHLTKEYRLGALTSVKDTVRHSLARITGRRTWQRERFKALDDLSFSIQEGEVVGVIGHNGSGKSTLLKHLANITTPTRGKVVVKGSVAPLIEVGAGVNPELTGRENIFLNAAILGVPKKVVRKKLDEIIAFSELEQFIDTPVKRYSSGMTVKLGFSIATSMDAEILIIDEVLAVGDLAFQRKCFDRMEAIIKREGKTVLLVSHNLRQVMRLCNRVILLDRGRVLHDGGSEAVCNRFYAMNNEKIQATTKAAKAKKENVETSGEFKLRSIDLIDDEKNVVESIQSRGSLNVRVRFFLAKDFRKPELIIGTHTSDFVYLTASSTVTFDDRPDFLKGEHEVIYSVDSFPLIEGSYSIRLSMFDENRRLVFRGESLKTFFVKEEHGVRSEHGWLSLNLPTRWTLQGREYAAESFSKA